MSNCVFQARNGNVTSSLTNAWKGYTLLLPSISYGNTGQLAVDLLLSTCGVADPVGKLVLERVASTMSTLSFPSPDHSPRAAAMSAPTERPTVQEMMEKLSIDHPRASTARPATKKEGDSKAVSNKFELVGWLSSCALVPVAGPDPFGDGKTMCSAADVYVNHSLRLLVVQLRSALLRGLKRVFIQEILDFATLVGVTSICCLSSAFSFTRSDAELQSRSQVRWTCTPQAVKSQIGKEFNKIFGSGLHYDSENGVIPGGGFAGQLLRQCSKAECPISCIVLFRFCSEGDNTMDAIDLANHLAACLNGIVPAASDESCFSTPEPAAYPSLLDNDDDGDNDNNKGRGANKPMFIAEQIRWRIPRSWQHLYGCRIPETLMAM